MKYEQTGSKVNKDTAKNAKEYTLSGLDSKTILIALLKRHKFGLSVTLNVVFAIYFFVPFLPAEIANLISSLV